MKTLVYDQDVYWVDRQGDVINIDDMGMRYRTNVVWFLRGRAVSIYRRYLERQRFIALFSGGGGYGGQWMDELERDPSPDECKVWLESTPLMVRLMQFYVADRLAVYRCQMTVAAVSDGSGSRLSEPNQGRSEEAPS